MPGVLNKIGGYFLDLVLAQVFYRIYIQTET